jgi:hypothetical protein
LRIGKQHFNPCSIDQHDRGIELQHRLDKSDLCDPPRITDAAGFDNDVIEPSPSIEQAAKHFDETAPTLQQTQPFVNAMVVPS